MLLSVVFTILSCARPAGAQWEDLSLRTYRKEFTTCNLSGEDRAIRGRIESLAAVKPTSTVQGEDHKCHTVEDRITQPAELQKECEVLNLHLEQLDYDVAATQQTSVAWEALGVNYSDAAGKQLNTGLGEEASPRPTLLQQQLAQEGRPVLSLTKMVAETESEWVALQGLPSRTTETLGYVSSPDIAENQTMVDSLQNKLQLAESHMPSLAEEIGRHKEASAAMRSCWFEDVEKLDARHNEQMQQRDGLVDRLQQELDERRAQLREASLNSSIDKQQTEEELNAKLPRSTLDKDHKLRQLHEQLDQVKVELQTQTGLLKVQQSNALA